MSNLRLIARLDIKGPDLIKPVQLEGVRKIGNPRVFAQRYYNNGIDEILYMDVVASLYDRKKLIKIVRDTAENIFVPMTVGGGLRHLEDVRGVLRAGADKVAINSEATRRPEIIAQVAQTFGSQCMVLQIDAKNDGHGEYEVYRDCGREHTGLDAVEWAKQGQKLGAGEILLTGIDHEGMRRGFDIELTRRVSEVVSIPVIASGGMGEFSDLVKVARGGKADAAAMAYVLHYNKIKLQDLCQRAYDAGLRTRKI